MSSRWSVAAAIVAWAIAWAWPALAQVPSGSPEPAPAIEAVPVPHEVRSRLPPLEAPKGEFVEFDASPFPYDGRVPTTGRPFFDIIDEDGRRGHRSARAGVLWEDVTYSDRRSLLFMPRGFDVRRPGVIVVFLHGNRATLERDVNHRQRVAAQIAEANINAVLVAPQLAINANDSSAGLFWESFGFARFLGEAGAHLARMHGDRRTRQTFATLPVVIVAYSGGFVPAAWALHEGGTGKRVIGVVLLDALYGEVDKYADWIARHRRVLRQRLYLFLGPRQRGPAAPARRSPHPLRDRLPAHLQGSVTFLRTGAASITRASSPMPGRPTRSATCWSECRATRACLAHAGKPHVKHGDPSKRQRANASPRAR